MKKADTTTAPTYNVDKDTIKVEFIGEILVNGFTTISQLVEGYKNEGLNRSFIDEIINEMLSNGDIELIPDSNPKEYRFPSTNSKEVKGTKSPNENFENPILQSKKIIDSIWEETRLVVLKRDHNTCRMCGDTNTLNVYPLNSHKGNPCDTPVEGLITLCKYCRKQVEKMLLDGIEPIYFVKI